MRTVLDVNVIISGLLTSEGSPAQVLRFWLAGAVEVVVSPRLLEELERALGYPKLRDRITRDEREEVLAMLRRGARLVEDPVEPPEVRSSDPDDDYVIALASASRAVIVSGDRHLLDLAGSIPVYTPAGFVELVEATA